MSSYKDRLEEEILQQTEQVEEAAQALARAREHLQVVEDAHGNLKKELDEMTMVYNVLVGKNGSGAKDAVVEAFQLDLPAEEAAAANAPAPDAQGRHRRYTKRPRQKAGDTPYRWNPVTEDHTPIFGGVHERTTKIRQAIGKVLAPPATLTVAQIADKLPYTYNLVLSSVKGMVSNGLAKVADTEGRDGRGTRGVQRFVLTDVGKHHLGRLRKSEAAKKRR